MIFREPFPFSMIVHGCTGRRDKQFAGDIVLCSAMGEEIEWRKAMEDRNCK